MRLAKTDNGITIVEVDTSKQLIMIIDDDKLLHAAPIEIKDGTIIFKNKKCNITFIESEDVSKILLNKEIDN